MINTAGRIPLGIPVRGRLRNYGRDGASYDEILTWLMDPVDRRAFVAETRRRLQRLNDHNLIDLEEIR